MTSSSNIAFQFDKFLLHHDPYVFKKQLIFNGYTRSSSPGADFVRIRMATSTFFIDAVAFTAMLDPKQRKKYWANYHVTGGKPFDLYNADGTVFTGSVADIWQDPSAANFTNNEGSWISLQAGLWKRLVDGVCKRDRDDKNSFKSDRFLDPFAKKYLSTKDLVITPRLSEFPILNVDDLSRTLKPLIPDATFCTWDDAKADGLSLVGSDIFNLVFTWVKPDTYKAMWKSFGLTALPLDWPDSAKADNANKSLKGEDLQTRQGRAINHDESVQIFRSKIIQRQASSTPREYGGGDTMGRGANEIFKIFWPKETGSANWLHRVALMFGAAGCSRDPAIDKLNIIFGTEESNTDMLRAELSVTRYLTKYSLSIGDPDPPAFIYTSNGCLSVGIYSFIDHRPEFELNSATRVTESIKP